MTNPGTDHIRPARVAKAIAGTPTVIWRAFRARAAIAAGHRINGRDVSLALIVGDAIRAHWRRTLRPAPRRVNNDRHSLDE
jgi:hypothetical protein